MVSDIYREWELLLLAIQLGIKLAFIYDGIRIFRFLIAHNNIFVSIEDLIFWTYAAIVIFEMQLERSYGVMRGFSILGMLLGMYLYSKILGERMLALAEKGSIVFKRQLTGIGKVFKIGLGKQKSVSKNNRRKHDEEKKNKKREETKQTGGHSGYHGSGCNACSSSRK